MGLFGLNQHEVRDEFRTGVRSYALTGHLPDHDRFWQRLEQIRDRNPAQFDRRHPRIAYLFTPRAHLPFGSLQADAPGPALGHGWPGAWHGERVWGPGHSATGLGVEALILPSGPVPGRGGPPGGSTTPPPRPPVTATPEPSALAIGVVLLLVLGAAWGFGLLRGRGAGLQPARFS